MTLFGGYLIGRVLVRNAADYRRFFRCFFWILIVFLPVRGPRVRLTSRSLVDLVLGKRCGPAAAPAAPRLGFYRVQGVPEHSILFGLFCSIVVANFFYVFYERTTGRLLDRRWLAMVMTFMSLSSAPNIAQRHPAHA